MIDISRLYELLSPEQLKAMEEVLEWRGLTLESFKLMRKDYSRLKSKVKSVEKKLLIVMEQVGDDDFVVKWITREIASIENKYKDIEHAIRHYNIAIRSFNSTINSPYFLSFNPQEIYHSPLRSLQSHLALAELRINNAMDAMRITERYFKNIASAFKGHANLMAARKQKERRERANEMKSFPK